MIDIKVLRENPEMVKENIKKKFQEHKLILVDEVLELDAKNREAKLRGDELRSKRNSLSSQIGMLMKEKVKEESGYWLTTNVKTDKDGDTIIVVYVGHKDSNEKVQFFIKPEKGQLTSDHKDMDPAKILSKIEVHFKGRKLTQDFDND